MKINIIDSLKPSHDIYFHHEFPDSYLNNTYYVDICLHLNSLKIEKYRVWVRLTVIRPYVTQLKTDTMTIRKYFDPIIQSLVDKHYGVIVISSLNLL